MLSCAILSQIWFVVVWCSCSTFRPMSDWLLWSINISAGLLLTIPYLLSRRIWVQVIVQIIADIVMIANLMYFRTYFSAIPPESYLFAGNLADFTDSVVDSLNILDVGFLIILVASIILVIKAKSTSTNRLWTKYGILTLSFCSISAIGILIRGGFYKAYDTLINDCYYVTCGVPTYTIGGHIAYNLIESHKASDPQRINEIDDFISIHETLAALPQLQDSINPKHNLVIIICESLESWPLGKTIGGKEITPVLNSLIADSTTLFAPKVLTQVDAGRSIDCQLMLNTGLLPMNGSVFSMKFADVTYPSINKALKEKYGTVSLLLTPDQPTTWNLARISHSFGYDHIFTRDNWISDELIGNPAKLSDGSFFRQSVEFLKSNDFGEGKPTMLTFVTYSGHNPFKLPEKLKDANFDLSDTGLPQLTSDYLTMAHYTDRQLKTLIDYLKSRDDWDDTMVVIIGDHEGLAGARQEERSNKLAAELIDDEQFTPLIILNSPIQGRYSEVMGQIDIYPTLLNLLGLDDYFWHGVGESIFSQSKIPAAISSMTAKTVGDTIGAQQQKIELMKEARNISDAIIRIGALRAHSLTSVKLKN